MEYFIEGWMGEKEMHLNTAYFWTTLTKKMSIMGVGSWWVRIYVKEIPIPFKILLKPSLYKS